MTHRGDSPRECRAGPALEIVGEGELLRGRQVHVGIDPSGQDQEAAGVENPSIRLNSLERSDLIDRFSPNPDVRLTLPFGGYNGSPLNQQIRCARLRREGQDREYGRGSGCSDKGHSPLSLPLTQDSSDSPSAACFGLRLHARVRRFVRGKMCL